jgi:hypothetical protein
MNQNLNDINAINNSNNNFVDSKEFFKKSPNLFYNNNDNYNISNNISNKKTNRLYGMKEFTFNNFKNSSMK